MSNDQVDIRLDREQAFLLYATFCGDLEKTAHALNVRPVDVLKMVEEEGWNERLKTILEMKKSAKPGDIERAINRALNYVQAHRMRLFVERILHKLVSMGDKEVEDYIFSDHSTKDGVAFKRLTTRAIADLASALEKAQSMSYLALADTSADRAKRKEAGADDGASAGDLSVQIAKAMASIGKSGSPRAMLFDAQIEVGQTLVKEATRPANPNDSDEH